MDNVDFQIHTMKFFKQLDCISGFKDVISYLRTLHII